MLETGRAGGDARHGESLRVPAREVVDDLHRVRIAHRDGGDHDLPAVDVQRELPAEEDQLAERPQDVDRWQERDEVVEPEETTLERAQEAAMARKAVDALAERDRLALLMREEGLDYNEIAEALQLSPGSVGTTLSRARRRLVESYETLQTSREEREKNAAS